MADPLQTQVFSLAGLRINGARLWSSLMRMAEIGAGKNGGSHRLALTNDDKAARDLLADWCTEAGCTMWIDGMGNMFARRPGTEPAVPPVLVGSHLDTQPEGGRFDGVLGVLAALEILRSLQEAGIKTRRSIELVNWTNEEGARFAPAMLGSAVFAGLRSSTFAHAVEDRDGVAVGNELRRIGYSGPIRADGGHPVHAFFELHIEQGPALENEDIPVGVVTHAQGVKWFDVAFKGFEGHAGTTPMKGRRDALLGAARLIERVNEIALSQAPQGVATVGTIAVRPASRNVIPGSATLSVDMRHPTRPALEDMAFKLRTAVGLIGAELDLEAECTEIIALPPVAFDESAVSAIRRGAERLGLRNRDIVSGALHDACNIASVAPTAMVFCPCIGGISHNEAENILPEWATAGANVLLQAVIETAEIVV